MNTTGLRVDRGRWSWQSKTKSLLSDEKLAENEHVNDLLKRFEALNSRGGGGGGGGGGGENVLKDSGNPLKAERQRSMDFYATRLLRLEPPSLPDASSSEVSDRLKKAGDKKLMANDVDKNKVRAAKAPQGNGDLNEVRFSSERAPMVTPVSDLDDEDADADADADADVVPHSSVNAKGVSSTPSFGRGGVYFEAGGAESDASFKNDHSFPLAGKSQSAETDVRFRRARHSGDDHDSILKPDHINAGVGKTSVRESGRRGVGGGGSGSGGVGGSGRGGKKGDVTIVEANGDDMEGDLEIPGIEKNVGIRRNKSGDDDGKDADGAAEPATKGTYF